MIRAVVFDLGGTLLEFNPGRLSWLEWERAGLEAAHAHLTAQGYALDAEPLVAAFVDALPGRWAQATQGRENLQLGDVLHEACAACGVVLTLPQVSEAVARYIAALDAQVEVCEGAQTTLDALCLRGQKIGLISNTMWPGEFHRRGMARLGLLSYFDHTVFSGDAGVWKPQPGVYHLSLAALGVRAEEAVFVGDSLEHDIVGAQGVGMRAVHKSNDRSGLEHVRPDATITHLSELVPLVDSWGTPSTP